MNIEKYDLVILGGGPGGYVAAIRASQLGMSVALIEREHLGGICLNWGCIPTKAMLKSAEVLSTLRKAEKFGLSVENIGFDLKKIVTRSKNIASQLSAGVKHLLSKHKVTIINGYGSLQTKNLVKITSGKQSRDIHANNIIIATGGRARELAGFESDGTLIWNYKHALRPPKLPKKILIVGSGAIGVEFASFYNSLGCKITIIELNKQILPNEDIDIAEYAKKEFENNGITIFENSSILGITKEISNINVQLKINDEIKSEVFDTIIMAVGIVGNTENIGLERLGINVKNNHIKTTNFCETNIENVYAIGDVTTAPWLAHKASHEGVLVVEKISGMDVHPIKESNIAGCTFCDPQIASIGLTEKKVREEGYSFTVGKFPFKANGKALAIGDNRGFVKTIFDKETGELLGAHLIGPEVTELIHGFVLGKQLESVDENFIETIYPHPTLSEAIHESVLNSSNRTIHF